MIKYLLDFFHLVDFTNQLYIYHFIMRFLFVTVFIDLFINIPQKAI